MDYSYLKGSDGTGKAILAHVQSNRSVGSTVIDVDSVDNWPANFIVTTGVLLSSGFLDPATITEMRGHLNAGDIIIDEFLPGSTDVGNTDGQVAMIKPTTAFADAVVNLAEISHNPDGTMKAASIRSALGIDSGSLAGWTPLSATPNTITDNGNRSYTAVFSGADLTPTLSNGMRLLFQRNVPAPTQCTLLNGTSQYYSKAAPAGMTFTDDFTVSAWVKLTSYSGSDMTIASRYNGTSGWQLVLQTSGQILLTGRNGGAGNFSFVNSSQSVPLNKWVHIVAQLDMSAFTATPTTSYIMIDGVDIPSIVSRSGTNPVALVQAGNLEIGSQNGGTNLWPGKIAQVAIYNAKVAQATARAAKNQALVGTEASLISAYSFNNSINDLNATNANNLTANGSAVATNADSPYAQGATAGVREYGLLMANSLAGGNTTITFQVAEGSAVPTTGGVSAASYSPHKAPYGFPAQKSKWSLLWYLKNNPSQAPATADTWYNLLGAAFFKPIGSWRLNYSMQIYADVVGGGDRNLAVTLSSSSSSQSNEDYSARFRMAQLNANIFMTNLLTRTIDLDAEAASTYYVLVKSYASNVSTLALQDTNTIFAEPAGL